MNTITVSLLITAIRNAESLAELQRMVGPCDQEQEKAERRMSQIDNTWNSCNGDLDSLSAFTKLRYDQLMIEQNEFENKYC